MSTANNTINIRMKNKINFPQWLQDQLDARGWGQSDLANRAHVNRQVIWAYLNGRKKPGTEILKKIAKVLEIPPEEIYQAAGMLPAEPEPDLLDKAIMYMLRGMSNEEKRYILENVKLRRKLSGQDKDDK